MRRCCAPRNVIGDIRAPCRFLDKSAPLPYNPPEMTKSSDKPDTDLQAQKAPESTGGGFGTFMRHIRARLVSGFLILLPLSITLLVIGFLFRLLSGFIAPFVRTWVPHLPPAVADGISFAATLTLIYLLGLLSHHVIGRRLVSGFESLILRVPVLKTVYGSSKQMIEMISASGKSSPFQSVALCEFPYPGAQALCFVTGTIVESPSGRELCRVFVPTAPNPTSGFLLFLPRDKLRSVDITVEECIRLLMSGGVLGNNAITSAAMDTPALER